MANERIKENLYNSVSDLLTEDQIIKKRIAEKTFLNQIRFSRTTWFKLFLLISDILIAVVGFGLGLWITGWNAFVVYDFTIIISFFLLGLLIISIFILFHLYDFHLIFFLKGHIKNLLKAFSTYAFTILVASFLLSHTSFLRDNYTGFMVAVFLSAIGFILITRYYQTTLLLLMPFGMALFIVGYVGLVFREGIPNFIFDGSAIFVIVLLLVTILSFSRIILVNLIFNKWLKRFLRRQVVFVGQNVDVEDITKYIINCKAPFWVAGTLGTEKQVFLAQGAEKKSLGDLLSLPNIVKKYKIDELIVTDDTLDKKTLISLLDYCTSFGISVWFPPKLMPIIDIKLYVDTFCGLPMIRLGSQKHSRVFDKFKHSFDALTGILLLLVLFPFFFLIAAAIKIDSNGPVFYLAKAIGKNAKKFNMFKFRSMKINQDHTIHKNFVTQLIEGKIVKEDDKAGQPLKITEDPRITGIGRIIRKFSIDELPQIINVLKGEMSLVGPRPCLPYEFEIYPDWYKKRVHVRPGITGLWQVTGRSEVAVEDMVLLDLYYIYNRNFMLDLQILFETIFVVLTKRGAY